MKSITLHIKNMVCSRCIMIVRNELEALGANVFSVELGYASVCLPRELPMEKVVRKLQEYEFDLIKDQDTIILEQTKIAMIAFLHMPHSERVQQSLSQFISYRVGKNYNYISKLFSKQINTTIEQYFIQLRIEKAKELLDYDELSLGQIANQLGYSSVQYLSSQFKKVMGISVSSYKKKMKSKAPLRKPLDKI